LERISAGKERAVRRLGFPSLLPALLITSLSAVFASAASLAAPATGKIGVVFSPGLSSQAAVERVIAAGGAPIDMGRFGNIVIAWARSSDFQNRVDAEGAWLTFNPQGLGGCLRFALSPRRE